MTPHDLIAAFDAVAQAPDGVARVRELVLHLAVCGRLVPQDPTDEPASVLLKRITTERPRLMKAEKLRKEEPLRSLSEGEMPFDVPDGWSWARFSDVANIASHLVSPSEFGSMPHVAPDNIEKGTGRMIGFRTVAEDGVASGKHRFRAGQILYSKIRPNLSKVITVDFAGLCSADMYPIDPWVDRGYLFRFMLSRLFIQQVTTADNRLAMPKVNQHQLSAVQVPIPPLAEQHRIVARVDELMGLLDQLDAARIARDATRAAARDSVLDALREADTPDEVEVAWTRCMERLDDLLCDPTDIAPVRQMILQLAVRGRLVPHDRAEGIGQTTIDDVRRERNALVEKGLLRGESNKRASVIDAPPFDIPKTWAWAELAEIAVAVTDGDHQPPPQVPHGIPFAVIGNVSRGWIDLSNTRRVPREYFDDLEWTRKPRPGDLLYTVTGSYGVVVVVGEIEPFCVQRHIGIIKTARCFDNQYLAYALRSRYAFAFATDVSTGIAQKTVPLSGLRRLPVPVPPLAEQHRIVARVGDLMALLDQLEERLISAQRTHAAFAAAAVHHFNA